MLGKQRCYDLVDRICVASKKEIIDEDTRANADEIRERGNDAIHDQPDITKNALGMIGKTVAVLEKLYEK